MQMNTKVYKGKLNRKNMNEYIRMYSYTYIESHGIERSIKEYNNICTYVRTMEYNNIQKNTKNYKGVQKYTKEYKWKGEQCPWCPVPSRTDNSCSLSGTYIMTMFVYQHYQSHSIGLQTLTISDDVILTPLIHTQYTVHTVHTGKCACMRTNCYQTNTYNYGNRGHEHNTYVYYTYI